MENFLTSIAPLIVLITPFLLFYILRLMSKKKKKQKEKYTSEFINNVSSKEFGINTKFLEAQLFRTVENLIGSFYTQDPNGLPAQHMSPELYFEWYEKMKREYEFGIKKNVLKFEVLKMRVAKQKKEALNIVSSIEVEASFDIEYDYHHVTAARRMHKRYKQRFVFISNNQSWYLDKVLSEESF